MYFEMNSNNWNCEYELFEIVRNWNLFIILYIKFL